MARGSFITFEGGEGAGKSTQAQRLAQRLRSIGHSVTLTREPGGTPLAEALRDRLLADDRPTLTPLGVAAVFAAARLDHTEAVIQPALRQGNVVICDRYADSTRAYQGVAGVSPKALSLLETLAVGRTWPDLTFVIDVPVAVGRDRVVERGRMDPFERDPETVQEARRQAFLDIAAHHSDRCAVLDGTGSPDTLALKVWQTFEERLPHLLKDTQ